MKAYRVIVYKNYAGRWTKIAAAADMLQGIRFTNETARMWEVEAASVAEAPLRVMAALDGDDSIRCVKVGEDGVGLPETE